MDNTEEIAPLPVAKPSSALAKAAAVAGGVAAGVGGMVLAINASIASNLRKLAQPGFDRLKEMREQAAKDESEWSPLADRLNDVTTAEQRFDHAQEFQTTLRSEFHQAMFTSMKGDERVKFATGEGLIAKAYKGAKASDRIFNFGSKKLRQDIVDAAKRKGVPTVGENELTPQRFQEILFNIEEKNMERAILSTPSHIPLKDRLLLSKELELSGGQKGLAAAAFAAVAAVTAGVIYYGVKHFKSKKEELAQMQDTGIL